MDRFPEAFKDIGRAAITRFPSELDKAIAYAERELRKDPEFMSHVDLFIRTTVKQIVYAARAASTMQQKRAACGRPSINTAESKAVQDVASDMSRYFVNGTNVGDMQGEELEGHAEHCEHLADGHQQNARLFRLLRPLVPDGKTVRQCVTPKKFAALVRKSKVRREHEYAEAGH